MNRRIICFLLALVMTSLPLASCGGKPSAGAGDGNTASGGGNVSSGDVTDKTGDVLIHGSASENIGEFAVGGDHWAPYVWGGFIFSEGAEQTDHGIFSRIIFRDMTDPESEWMSLLDCDLEEYDVPVGFKAVASDIEIVIDDEATAENGGVPVFVIAYTLDIFENNNSHNHRYETRVATFDMKTQKLTTIGSVPDGSLAGTVYMYHGAIWFGTTVFDSEQGKSIASKHMITVKDGEYTLTTVDGTSYPSLRYIADGVIYYSDLEKVYSSALDFSGLSYLFDAYEVICADSEYIYYLTVDLTETFVTTSFALCRKKLGDISAPGEVVFSSEDLTGDSAAGYGCYCFGGDLYVRTEIENEGSVICLYDIKTGEYRKLIESEEEIYPTSSSIDYLLAQGSGELYICVDKKTGEITSFERWQNPW